MSEVKHTPGPWEAFTYPGFNGWWSVRDSHGQELGAGDGGVSKADAILIAAAPELLEALQYMLHIFDRDLPKDSFGGKACDEARAAIAKATGTA